MPNIIPLIMRQEYTDNIFFRKCLYRTFNGNHIFL